MYEFTLGWVNGSEGTRINDHWRAHLRPDQLNYPYNYFVSKFNWISLCMHYFTPKYKVASVNISLRACLFRNKRRRNRWKKRKVEKRGKKRGGKSNGTDEFSLRTHNFVSAQIGRKRGEGGLEVKTFFDHLFSVLLTLTSSFLFSF